MPYFGKRKQVMESIYSKDIDNPYSTDSDAAKAIRTQLSSADRPPSGQDIAQPEKGNPVGPRLPIENPGAVFDEMDDAGKSAIGTLNPLSKKINKEGPGFIFVDKNTRKVGGSDPYETGEHGGKNLDIPKTMNGEPLADAFIIGEYHTHGGYVDANGMLARFAREDPNHPDDFSDADRNTMMVDSGKKAAIHACPYERDIIWVPPADGF